MFDSSGELSEKTVFSHVEKSLSFATPSPKYKGQIQGRAHCQKKMTSEQILGMEK